MGAIPDQIAERFRGAIVTSRSNLEKVESQRPLFQGSSPNAAQGQAELDFIRDTNQAAVSFYTACLSDDLTPAALAALARKAQLATIDAIEASEHFTEEGQVILLNDGIDGTKHALEVLAHDTAMVAGNLYRLEYERLVWRGAGGDSVGLPETD